MNKDNCIRPINNNRTSIYLGNKMPTIYESNMSVNNCTKIRCNSLDPDKIKCGRIRSCSIDEIISGRIRSSSIGEIKSGRSIDKKIHGCSHIRRINELINWNSESRHQEFPDIIKKLVL